jgi:hypothetical protein
MELGERHTSSRFRLPWGWQVGVADTPRPLFPRAHNETPDAHAASGSLEQSGLLAVV